MAARRRFEFYLHRDLCAVEIWLWWICIYTVSGGDATKNGDFPIRKQRLQGSIFFFPKDSYLGALRLFLRVQAAASASPLIFRRRLGYVRWISISRDPRGAQDFDWVALPCALSLARNSLAATRPRSHSLGRGKKSGGPGVRTQDLTIRTRSFDHLVKRVPIQNGVILWGDNATNTGGDATENGDFPIRKQRLQGSIFFYGDDFKRCDEDVGAMRPKMAIFQ